MEILMQEERIIALLHGPDRAGIVARVSGWIYARGGNILHADQHRDRQEGIFFQRVEWIPVGDKIFFFALQFLSILYFVLISVNSANYIYLNSFNLSSAKTAYFYLIYTQFVGICATFLWIICITKIDTSLHTAKRRHRHHSHT